MSQNIFIVSVSSDIGLALANHFIANGHVVHGTYRRLSPGLQKLQSQGLVTHLLDLTASDSLNNFFEKFSEHSLPWDQLIFCTGQLSPVSPFLESNFYEWETAIKTNLLAPLQVLHFLMKYAQSSSLKPLVLFFAGGGTNGAPRDVSAYTLSKIALIKMCELLAVENDDARFCIVGPGWVDTKIHQQILEAKDTSPENYQQTKKHYQENNFVSMDRVIQCVEWIGRQECKVINGRNFSVAYDPWDQPKIYELLKNPETFKLRRYGNNL